MKLHFSILLTVMAFLALQGCSPMGEGTSGSNSESQTDLSSSFDPSSLSFGNGPPRTTVPAPAPQPVPPPPPPPGPIADVVCTHVAANSYCNSKSLSVNIDEMEKFVRANNKSLNRRETICLPADGNTWRVNPNYPISWICTSALSYGRFDVDFPFGNLPEDRPELQYTTRVEALNRPATGYRSYRHFNAPYRCLGAFGKTYRTYQGENENVEYQRSKMLCYFSLNQLPAEALGDAVAQAQEFANFETANFMVNCTIKIRMIGPNNAKNIPANVLECTYDNPPAGRTVTR